MSHRAPSLLRPVMVSVFLALGLVVAGCALKLASSSSDASPRPLDKDSVANVGNGVGLRQEGAWWFQKETFGGNGRTCSTCHSEEDGFSTTPASAQKRFAADPKDSLFHPVDSDDGVGDHYTRLLTHATIRVRIPLKCPNIWLEDDPTATSVVLNRGIPELLDTPALDAKLMSDGRAAGLEQQALDAIHNHAHPTIEPDAKDLQRIAEYERTDEFFSSNALRDFARGGPAPNCRLATPRKRSGVGCTILPNGLCGRCHSGPMLNTTTASSPVVGPDQRFNNTRTGELVPDQIINPFLKWHVIQTDGTHRVFQTFADPGRMLISCKREDLTKFKIRSLWNVKNTAPYFHDNSAKTLEDVIAHYKQLFIRRKLPVSDQDLSDMLAYLRLL